MISSFKKLRQQQIEAHADQFSTLASIPLPRKGWIRSLRNAFGMTNKQLARKLGLSQTNLTKIEKREIEGTCTLKTLAKIAEAMNCKVVYAVVPIKPIKEILEDRAKLIARKRIAAINHSMKLEQQGLTLEQLTHQNESLVRELLEGNPKDLWNDYEI
jgi:predicted DNA-binding mobile mystery protein A